MRGSPKRKLGILIKRLRRSRNMSQQSLAAAVGVHVNTVARWERDGIDPHHDALPRIAAALTGGEIDATSSDANASQTLRLSAVARLAAAYRARLPSLSQAALGDRSRWLQPWREIQ